MLQVVVVLVGLVLRVIILVKHLDVVGLGVRLGPLTQGLLALEVELVVLEEIVLDQRLLGALFY
jgi:hypothetical protein